METSGRANWSERVQVRKNWWLSEDWIDVGMDYQALKEPGKNRSNEYGSKISRRSGLDNLGNGDDD